MWFCSSASLLVINMLQNQTVNESSLTADSAQGRLSDLLRPCFLAEAHTDTDAPDGLPLSLSLSHAWSLLSRSLSVSFSLAGSQLTQLAGDKASATVLWRQMATGSKGLARHREMCCTKDVLFN